LQIPEADFERLIRVLSEARARATELATSISARLGTEHHLAELANAASSKIETMLLEVRSSASQATRPAAGLAELRGALEIDMQPITPEPGRPEQAPMQHASSEREVQASAGAPIAVPPGLDPEHWLSMFVNDLVSQLRISGSINFEVAERLLQQRKDDFLRNFLIARRMYRTYPQLFPEIQQHESSPEHQIPQ
jgi:hypothetical protein